MSHPIRNHTIHVFQRRDGLAGGTPFIARFHPYDTFPIFFKGATEQAVIDAAEAFRTETIQKHEASVIARQEGQAKARSAREAKVREIAQ